MLDEPKPTSTLSHYISRLKKEINYHFMDRKYRDQHTASRLELVTKNEGPHQPHNNFEVIINNV